MTEELLHQILSELKDIRTRAGDQKETDELEQTNQIPEEKSDYLVATLSMQVDYLTGEINALKENVIKQEKIIRTLSLRTFEQEADIRALRSKD